jgi:hypothetical protein
MPNDEYVALLVQGARAWNEWRAKFAETPDLYYAVREHFRAEGAPGALRDDGNVEISGRRGLRERVPAPARSSGASAGLIADIRHRLLGQG